MQTRSMSVKSALSKNPLYIPEITDHMFQFLPLSDIKNCRLVCQKWNKLAEKFLIRLSIVNIRNAERAEEFNQVFPNAEQSQIFSCFQLGCQYDKYVWPVSKLVSFFEKWHHNLSEISLLRPDFGLEKENKTYALPLLPSTLTKLHIESSYDNNRMILSTDKICNIRILQLEGCILNIMPGTTLNSVEINLTIFKFRKGKEDMEEFLINPLLNFDVLRKATFSGQNIKLDVQGSHSLEMLDLQMGVKVVNWETSNWEIRKLFFHVYHPWNESNGELWKSQMKYVELETALTHLNVSLLPEGIEKLQILFDSDGKNTAPIFGEHKFSDLKNLNMTFHTGIDFSPFAEVFKHSPKLETLSVSTLYSFFGACSEASILKTSSIPPSVKTLRVKDVRIILDQSLELETLVVHYAVNEAQRKGIVQVAEGSHIKNLVCVLKHRPIDRNFPSDKERGNFIKSLIDLKLDNFVVGDFPQVDNSAFEKSYLFPLVDTQAKYYLFQPGEKGKAISDRDAKIYRKAAKNNCFQLSNKIVKRQ